MPVQLSPAAQLAYIAIGQITEWAIAAKKAQENPDMTQAEADQLEADTKARAAQTLRDLNAAIADRENSS